MRAISPIERLKQEARAAGFDAPLAAFLNPTTSSAQRTQVMLAALRGPLGERVRDLLGRWIAETLEELVPASAANWRVLVRDAMLFVATHLSNERLAPKLVEQLELPTRCAAERRLMLLISKVPGLQKLGQVLARNRALQPPLRRALSRLENGIRDVKREDVRNTVVEQLSRQIEEYVIVLRKARMSEATVSAVLPFTWRDPESGERQRGVFKVMKPHIRAFFAEDMELLQGLAHFLRRNHRKYGVGARGLADMFGEVRLLLQHEVDLRGEQRRLEEAAKTYRGVGGMRVPKVIPALCTDSITAMSEEEGLKITVAAKRMSAPERRRVAETVIQSILARPLFATTAEAVFHADPHAGNLLYNARSKQVVVLDWALTGTLTSDQRRHLTVFLLMVLLRDRVGTYEEVLALSLQQPLPRTKREAVRRTIEKFIDELPVWRMPDSMDAMSLLQKLAFETVRLPGSLILLRKVMFTLEGVVDDIVGKEMAMDTVLVRSLFWRWLTRKMPIGAPLELFDWLRLQNSTLLSGSRWVLAAAQRVIAT